jgi:hypothetical protein
MIMAGCSCWSYLIGWSRFYPIEIAKKKESRFDYYA